MRFWKRVRSKWASPAPLIAFAILCTLPWVDVSCNYEFSDEIKRSANRVAESGREDIVSQFVRARSGQQANSLAMRMLHAASVPVVGTQSGLQAAYGGYTDWSTWVLGAPPDPSRKPLLHPPGPAPLLALCFLCVAAALGAAAWMRPGRARGLAIAAAACTALALLFFHDLRGFEIAESLDPENARIAREYEESRKARERQNGKGDDAPFAGPPTLELRYTVWYRGAIVVLMLGVLSGMAELRSSRKKELAGDVSRSRRSDAAIAAVALSFLGLCVSGWMWRTKVHARADTLARQAREAEVARVKATRKLEQDARDSAERASRLRYITDMKKVQESWISDDAARFRQLLDAQLPSNQAGVDRRGFEWYYWQRNLAWDHVTLKGHRGGIRCVAFSPVGSRIASASLDGTAVVWDTASGQPVLTIKGHAGSVSGVAFSPDGKRLATASSDRTVKVWDAGTGTELQVLKGHARPVWCVAFAPDGKRLASGSFDHTVKLWDAATGREILTSKAHADPVTCVTFSHDGKWLASASRDGTTLIWDPDSGKARRRLQGHAPIWSVAFSPDGKSLASTGAGRNGTVTLWNAESGRAGQTLKGHEGAVNSVAFAQGGKRLATAGQDGTIKVWNPTTAQERLSIRAHAAAVNSVAWSPDGKRLASASWDGTVKVWDADPANETADGHERGFDLSHFPSGADSRTGYAATFEPDGTVKVSDVATGKDISTLRGHNGRVRLAAFQPGGRRIATTAADGTVRLWDTATGLETLSLAAGATEITSLAFSPDGHQLVAVGRNGMVKLWHARPPEVAAALRTNRVVGTFKVSTKSVALSPDGQRLAKSVALSPDGQRLALTGENETVRLVSARPGESAEITLEGATDSTTRLAFSTDGQRLAAAGASATATIWDTSTGRRVQTLPAQPKPITSLALSADGKQLATASLDHSVKLWDADSGQEIRILTIHTQMVSSLAFSPDGKWLASADADGTVTIRDFVSEKAVRLLDTKRYFIAGVAFSPDGKQFASPALNGVKVWDTETWKEAAYVTPEKHVAVHQGEVVAFSSDSKRLISAGSRVYVWDTETWQEIGMPPIELFFYTMGQGAPPPTLSSDGNRLATIRGDGTVTLWDLSPLAESADARSARR
jgi:WD40 repeat protein